MESQTAEVMVEEQNENLDPSGMSDAELSAQLGEEEQEAIEPQEEESAPAETAQKEGKPEEPEEQEPKEEAPAKEPSKEELAAKLETQTKRNADQEAYIKRLQNEVGERRKWQKDIQTRLEQIRQEKAKLNNVPPEQFIENPAGYHAYRDQLNEEQAKLNQGLQQVSQQEQVATANLAKMQAHGFVQQHLPEFETSIPEIVESVKEDGIFPPEALAEFQRNPYSESPALLYGLYHRAQAKKATAEKDRQIAELQAQVEQLRAKPGEALRRVESAARSKPLSNASGGGGEKGGKVSVSARDIPNLSDKQLEELLTEAM